jgi:hypothetical protein
MSKPNIETLQSEVEQLLNESISSSFMQSRALMSVDLTSAHDAEEFKQFARDFHRVVYEKLDILDNKVRELVAATKN